MSSRLRLGRALRSLTLAVSLGATGGCSVPKMLQEPFEQGVYKDILERQARNVPMEDEKLKDLPAMTSADYEKLGDTYLLRGQPGLARSKYQKALDLDPASWRLLYKIGTVQLRTGSPGDALESFRSITAKDPGNSRGWEGQGRALLAMKDHEEAEKALRESVRLDSGNWQAQQALGMVYDDLGRLDEAIACYSVALRVRPGEASLLNNMGVALYLKKQYREAIDSFGRALRTAPEDERPRIFNNIGRAEARSGAWQRAFDSFRRGGDAATAYNNVGIVMLEQGDARNAAACFHKAMEASRSFYAAASENLKVAEDRAGGAGGGHCP